ncbi:hypothetical protein ACFWDA_05855 [Rhodococcus zopfii]|uniref:hypothetical protein n=1 Tax=Rhodococcus zopfii TaxID=43772 RepID=UPI003527CA19
MRDLGLALGPVLVGAIALSAAGTALGSGFSTAFLVAAALLIFPGLRGVREVAPSADSAAAADCA